MNAVSPFTAPSVTSGKSFLGTWASNANTGVFSQSSFNTATGYAIKQDQNGYTVVNGASGQGVSLRIGDSDGAVLSGTGWSFVLPIAMNGTPIIDSTGNLSAPSLKLTNQSSVRAYHNTTQSIGGTWTQLLFNTVSSPGYDNKSEWNTATSRFTASAAGTYLVSVTCLLSTYNANNRVVMEIQKGGVAYQRLFDLSSSGTWLQADGFCTVQITNPATEYLTFHLIALSGTVGTNGGSYGNAVTIHRIM